MDEIIHSVHAFRGPEAQAAPEVAGIVRYERKILLEGCLMNYYAAHAGK